MKGFALGKAHDGVFTRRGSYDLIPDRESVPRSTDIPNELTLQGSLFGAPEPAVNTPKSKLLEPNEGLAGLSLIHI